MSLPERCAGMDVSQLRAYLNCLLYLRPIDEVEESQREQRILAVRARIAELEAKP